MGALISYYYNDWSVSFYYSDFHEESSLLNKKNSKNPYKSEISSPNYSVQVRWSKDFEDWFLSTSLSIDHSDWKQDTMSKLPKKPPASIIEQSNSTFSSLSVDLSRFIEISENRHPVISIINFSETRG